MKAARLLVQPEYLHFRRCGQDLAEILHPVAGTFAHTALTELIELIERKQKAAPPTTIVVPSHLAVRESSRRVEE